MMSDAIRPNDVHKENSYRFSCKNVGAIIELSMGLEREWRKTREASCGVVR